MGRSSVTSLDRPAITSTTAAVVTKEASAADTLYLPGARPTKLKWPSPSERMLATFLSAASVTTTSAPGSRTVPCVVTVPCSTPVRGGCAVCAGASAGKKARNVKTRSDRNPIDLNLRPKNRNYDADHNAEGRAGEDVHCIVVSAYHAGHPNARGNTQQNGPGYRQRRDHADRDGDRDGNVTARKRVHTCRPTLHDVRREAMDPAGAQRRGRFERPRRARLKDTQRRKRPQV